MSQRDTPQLRLVRRYAQMLRASHNDAADAQPDTLDSAVKRRAVILRRGRPKPAKQRGSGPSEPAPPA
jgi:hypothetical protein